MRTVLCTVETARLFSAVAYCPSLPSWGGCTEWEYEEDEDSENILFGHYSGFL
jgi:hypothetical protein